MFLWQVRLRKGLPFDVKIPNEATLKAMQDAEEGRHLSSYERRGLSRIYGRSEAAS